MVNATGITDLYIYLVDDNLLAGPNRLVSSGINPLFWQSGREQAAYSRVQWLFVHKYYSTSVWNLLPLRFSQMLLAPRALWPTNSVSITMVSKASLLQKEEVQVSIIFPCFFFISSGIISPYVDLSMVLETPVPSQLGPGPSVIL